MKADLVRQFWLFNIQDSNLLESSFYKLFKAMYHASSSADENISMNMGLGGQDGGNGMFNDASSTEADGKLFKDQTMVDDCIMNFYRKRSSE